MSFIDSQLQFSVSQALSSTAASTNVVDIGVARNLFDGTPMAVVVIPIVSADFTTGDESYEIKLQSCAAVGFGSGVVTHVDEVVPAASLVAGTKYVLPIPTGVNILQFVRIDYVLGGTTPSVTVEAYLEPLSGIDKQAYYKDNSTIS